jgi:hypothetical protein
MMMMMMFLIKAQSHPLAKRRPANLLNRGNAIADILADIASTLPPSFVYAPWFPPPLDSSPPCEIVLLRAEDIIAVDVEYEEPTKTTVRNCKALVTMPDFESVMRSAADSLRPCLLEEEERERLVAAAAQREEEFTTWRAQFESTLDDRHAEEAISKLQHIPLHLVPEFMAGRVHRIALRTASSAFITIQDIRYYWHDSALYSYLQLAESGIYPDGIQARGLTSVDIEMLQTPSGMSAPAMRKWSLGIGYEVTTTWKRHGPHSKPAVWYGKVIRVTASEAIVEYSFPGGSTTRRFLPPRAAIHASIQCDRCEQPAHGMTLRSHALPLPQHGPQPAPPRVRYMLRGPRGGNAGFRFLSALPRDRIGVTWTMKGCEQETWWGTVRGVISPAAGLPHLNVDYDGEGPWPFPPADDNVWVRDVVIL